MSNPEVDLLGNCDGINDHIYAINADAKFANDLENKKRFLNETIHINLLENEGKLEDRSWKIQRFRLTKLFLQDLVKRSVVCVDDIKPEISYLKASDDGEIIVPDECQSRCRTKPTTYCVFLKKKNKTRDVSSSQGIYSGGMIFLLNNVPLSTQNQMHVVTPSDIRRWIIGGILDQDLVIQNFQIKQKNVEERIRILTREIQKVSTESAFASNGSILKGKLADKEKETKTLRLNRERENAYQEREFIAKQIRAGTRKRLENLEITVNQGQKDLTSGRSSWSIAFCGANKNYYESLILKQHSWPPVMTIDPETRDGDDAIDSLVCKKDDSFETEHVVDMNSVEIEKVEHGYGNFFRTKKHATKFKSFENHIDYYLGTYNNGKKSGHGTLFLSSGVYLGKLVENMPNGTGKVSFKDGDILSGTFDYTSERKIPVQYHNRYARSSPTGKCSITFSDGGFYEGEMQGSTITGEGIYVSANGEISEGLFSDGILCRGKITMNDSSCSIEGTFRHGLAHGMCEEVNHASRFSGSFRDGLKDGRGTEVYTKQSNTYTGYFSSGFRHGMGELEFLNEDSNRKKRSQYICKGNWLAGLPRSGGIIMDKNTLTSLPSMSKVPERFPWFRNLPCSEQSYHHKIKKINRQEIEYFASIRREIQFQKRSIFESSRERLKHIFFTKGKTLLENTNDDDTMGEEMLGLPPIDFKFDDRLPIKSKYYTLRPVLNAPKCLDDAIKNPGLTIEVRSSSNEGKILESEIQKLDTEMKNNGYLVHHSQLSKCVQSVYSEIFQKWELINLDNIKEKALKMRTSSI